MVDLKRVVIILMSLAVVCCVVGVIHCHSTSFNWSGARYYLTGYYITFPILLCMSSFLLVEQLLITDGTVPPLNRLRIIFAFAAAIVLFVFGVVAAVQIRHNPNSPNDSNVVIAAVISFIGMVIYIAEAVARNRKSRLV